jgi:flagellar biosynthesis protein FlhG
MDQADRLRTLTTLGGHKTSTRVISVTSGKGGVGKTNIAVNLAVICAHKGLKVLVIDGDLGLSNTHILAGSQVRKTLDDVMFYHAKIEETFSRAAPGFDILPSATGMRKLLNLGSFERRAMFDQLFSVMNKYDLVIYDTAPGLGDHVLEFNVAAHDIVVVANAEPTSIADSYALIKVLSKEKQEKKFKFLVNRTLDHREGLDAYKKLTEVALQFLNVSIDLLGSLPEDAHVAKSVRCSRPISLEYPRSFFSISLERIADKLLAGSLAHPPKKLWDNQNSMGSNSLGGILEGVGHV